MGERGPLASNVTPIPMADSPLTAIEVPDPPKGLLKRTYDVWEQYWQSTVSRTIQIESDLPVVLRWIGYVDEWHRAMRTIKTTGHTVEGSQDQPVLSPTAHYISKLETMIGRLEAHLGLTPLARARLGLSNAEGKMAVAQLNAMARADDAEFEDDYEPDEEETDQWKRA